MKRSRQVRGIGKEEEIGRRENGMKTSRGIGIVILVILGTVNQAEGYEKTTEYRRWGEMGYSL